MTTTVIETAPQPAERDVVFDLETASSDDLHRYGPGFVRIAGYTGDDGRIRVTTRIDGLARYLERADRVSGHNILGFDLVALAKYHGLDIHALVRRGAVFDTLLAARHVDPPAARSNSRRKKYDLDSLGERLGFGEKSDALKKLSKLHGGYDKIPVDDLDYRRYCAQDIALSMSLRDHYADRRDDAYLVREHRIAAIAAQINLNGWQIDVDLLHRRLEAGEERKAKALAWLQKNCGVPLEDEKGRPRKSPLASKAGKEALEAALIRHGAKRLPRTEKSGELQTSAEAMKALEKANRGNIAVAKICRAVSMVVTVRTIYETVAKYLVGDRVHPWVSMEQSTGRCSVTKPGLTVMGKRGGRYVEREVFLPDPGHVMIAVDLSQVDARSVAHLSGDKAYRALFEPGLDLHAEIAYRVWGDRSRREQAKAIGHGWNYGMGVRKLSETTGLPVSVAQEFDRQMREQFPRLVEWRAEVAKIAESGALLDNGFGRRMRPDPERAYTQGPAFMGQGFARDVLFEGLLELVDRAPDVLPYLRGLVHDEVVLSVPKGDAEEINRLVADSLSFSDRWDVPIVAEPSERYGENWGALYVKD